MLWLFYRYAFTEERDNEVRWKLKLEHFYIYIYINDSGVKTLLQKAALKFCMKNAFCFQDVIHQ